jgi:hypothetical protein
MGSRCPSDGDLILPIASRGSDTLMPTGDVTSHSLESLKLIRMLTPHSAQFQGMFILRFSRNREIRSSP